MGNVKQKIDATDRLAGEVAHDFNKPLPKMEIPCGTETILFAEDEQLLRNLGKQIRPSGGYRILATKDGHEAFGLYPNRAIRLTPATTTCRVCDSQRQAENPRLPWS